MTQPLSNLPPEARRLMAQIGPLWGTDMPKYRDMVLATYAPLLRGASREGVKVTREQAYGAHPRQRLDVFQPSGTSAAPVVVFVHGGAFIRGNKSVEDGIYDNVLYWFARNGCLGVNVEYRLAPEATFPAGAEDVGLAMDWVVQNAATYGADVSRIHLVGHSAGATHIATYVADPNVSAKPGPELAGAVLISGRLRADALPQNPNAAGVRAYFGADPALYEVRSPVTHAHRFDRPLLIAIAEFENPLLDVYGAEYYWRVSAARGRSPRFLRMQMHNHSSMAMHFNSGDEQLGLEILDFISKGA